jgi:hypothetical protein
MGGVGSGAKPRDYPREIVQLVQDLYESGMTVREVSQAIPKGYKAQNIIQRYGIATRPRAKRDQFGSNNHMWRGSRAKYQALHLRVDTARGKPTECEWCGQNDPLRRYEWANLTGHYDDVNDFARLCVYCHRQYDASRRAQTGRKTTEGWR